MSDRVRVEVRGRHARLTLDDGQMNLLSNAGLDAIGEALDSIHLLIRGESLCETSIVTFESGRPGLFAAGADMLEMREFRPDQASEFSRKGQNLFRRLARFPALTAVMIDGDCFGGALDFVMSFDVRIASSRARFSHPGAKIGIVTGFGGTTSWRGTARPAAAGRLFLNNQIISAADAMRLGLIREITENPEGVIEKLIEATGELRGLNELKWLASSEKNLASLALQAKRLQALVGAAGSSGRNGAHGHSRDASRHIFG